MADGLSGARMKLQRAEEHFGELRRQHAEFLDRNPYRCLLEDDPSREGHAYLWRVKVIEAPPLEKWSSLLGDCVHALRSALDHTAYALVNRGGALVSEDRPAFPILEDATQWSGTHPDRLKGVHPDALKLVEEAQPFKGGPMGEVLLNVHKLDVIDKHRRLHLVTSAVEGTAWESAGAELEGIEPGIGAFEDGSVVGRFVLAPDEPDKRMHMQTTFQFAIYMADGEPCAGLPVIPLLDRYRAMVGRVVTLFEPYV